MIDHVIRFLKRIAVLIPGLVAALFVTRDVYPVLDRQVPAGFAVLGAYIIGAYVLVPTFMRILRFFVRPKHIPHYSTTPDGFASDPVNIGLVGTKKQVIDAMTAAGWHLADNRSLRSIARMVIAILLHRSYPTAPFSHLYLFGRKHDFGFQLQVEGSPSNRHHVRFWACSPLLSDIERQHITFWQGHVLRTPPAQKQLWLGAASLDVGLGVIRHNAQLTHTVHPDTDAERDLIVRMLTSAKRVKKKKIIKVGKAYKLRNRVFRAHLKTDGNVAILTLHT
jgi:hypothetical protein